MHVVEPRIDRLPRLSKSFALPLKQTARDTKRHLERNVISVPCSISAVTETPSNAFERHKPLVALHCGLMTHQISSPIIPYGHRSPPVGLRVVAWH
jgi:hypothetical protein